ncbi:holo-ACP synthase [Macrococcoides caseolyticum]|uniref:holo-ACP synthase n=1 Tax=Macrococcoides caseolyticum TaxID=69966 RepID=UPI000EA93BB1|nr:holo-ACP synthase [Macrococcus caseolyticus]MBQ5152234.1 holo-[acyl-carrier-protein] synthase [Macrococcus caseolyticus]RKO16594.1 holo-[acyl-carrier-protein] synthase [Macrococcus caseolyticus]
MIMGIGTDILEISRVSQYIDDNKFLTRILHPDERERFDTFQSEKRKAEYLAGRFCVKEAYAKALGTGIGKVSFHDICCLNDASGKPYIKDDTNAHVSIAHTDTIATAYVIVTDGNVIL